jgi:hypothetical protein
MGYQLQTTANPTADLLGRVASFADGTDERESAAALRQDARLLGEGGCNVIVVGEKNRGKSSLINALIGRPDLLPVDADVATNVILTVGYAKDESAIVHSTDHPDGHFVITLDDIAEYAALDQETSPPTARHPEITRVDVGIDAPILRDGLVLIDTPGVGGLVAGHTALTLSLLERADALLFVVNGSVELRASEIEFLHQASHRVPTVLFALTGIDKYAGSAAVLKANRGHLARHAPRFADAAWFEVSNKLKSAADRALADGDDDMAGELLNESRFAPLLAEVGDRLIARVAGDRERLLLTGAADILRRLDDQAEQRLRSLAGDPSLAASIAAQREEIERHVDGGAQWRTNLTNRFAVLQSRLERRAGDSLVTLRNASEAAVAGGGKNATIDVQRGLRDGAQSIVADLENILSAEAMAIVASLTDDFGSQGVEVMVAELPPGIGVSTMPRFDRTGTSPSTSAGVDETGMVPWPTAPASNLPMIRQNGFSLPVLGDNAKAFGRDSILGAAGKMGQAWRNMPSNRRASVATGAVVVVAGIATAAFAIFRGMKRNETRDALLIHVDNTIRHLQAELIPGLRQGVATLRDDLIQRADDRLNQRARTLERTLAQVEADHRSAETELARQRDRVQSDREQGAALLTEITAQLGS